MPEDRKYTPPVRPALAIRVGITGTRTMHGTAEQIRSGWERTEHRIRDILTFIRAETIKFAADPVAAEVYALTDGNVVPRFRFLSPLADGSDRIAARVARELDYSLMVPMPFPRRQYEETFLPDPGGGGEFAELLDLAGEQCLELDGVDDDEAALSYNRRRSFEAAGRFVARNCDILIAVWDGKSANGRGGTFETLRFATEIGVPVWWINTNPGVEPAWLAEPTEPRVDRDRPDQYLEVSKYLRGLVLPPLKPEHALPGTIIERMVHWMDEEKQPRLLTFLHEPKPRRRRLWRSYDVFMFLATLHYRIRRLCEFISYPGYATRFVRTAMKKHARSASRHGHKHHRPAVSAGIETTRYTETIRYWDACYAAPNELSRDFAERFRSVYVLVFTLTAISLICAAVPLGIQMGDGSNNAASPLLSWVFANWVELSATVIEAVTLFAIGVLIWLNFAGRWHQRWIDYRVLAELFRKQSALAPLGWALPSSSIATLSEPHEEEVAAVRATSVRRHWGIFHLLWERFLYGRNASAQGQNEQTGPAVGHVDEADWIAWFYSAVARAAPFPSGHYDAVSLGQIRDAALTELVESQLTYHKQRRINYQAAERTLVRCGEALFVAVGLLVLCKFGSHWYRHHPPPMVEFGAVLLPTLAAAFLGVRHYAELELMVRQSDHMISIMRRAGIRLRQLDLTRPLASQDLGSITLGVAIEMLKDVDGWVRLFRVKVLEAT